VIRDVAHRRTGFVMSSNRLRVGKLMAVKIFIAFLSVQCTA